ncbi:hypothetical protein LJB77_02975 [Ruminococcaceae bacterium OttesenSCG-928-N02]|nr:hypothetical protein [Ruminococcaceae bacterium OttesenSCG-928-N02]
MQVKDMALIQGITPLALPGAEVQIKNIFCGDLHSWALAHLQANGCWCTVMANINTVAVAALQDAACVVLCHGTAYTQELIDTANERGVNLFATSLPEFEAACIIMKELEKEK